MLSKLAQRSVIYASRRCPGAMSIVLNNISDRRPIASTTRVPESHEFKAETRKLLNIVAKSLYTDKEVFIRELISNSSDALEKLRYLDSTHQIASKNDSDLPLGITVEVDEAKRLFVISDTGIGMTREELIQNLGTIARSGSKEFVSESKGDTDSKIIGQFGVGFYSTFVVADKVEVYSKTADASKDTVGYKWVSDGLGSFTVEPSDEITRGTKIVLHLKEDAVDFCKLETVKAASTKFSSFVDFPLKVMQGSGDSAKEITINQQEALWLKTDATTEQHAEFFRFLGNASYGEPMYTLTFHTDAPLSIKSVFYIPEDAPDRWFQQAPKVQVSLHSRRVLVKKHAEEIIPSWLHWVRGVVDCDDMPLNISRESMQDSALLKKLSMAVVRRFLRYLADEAKKDEAKYSQFWKKFGFYLKAGLLEDQQHNSGQHKDNLIKLQRFACTKNTNLTSLDAYIADMPESQTQIYYMNAPDRKTALASPYLEACGDRNVLVLTEDIDEFVANYIGSFKDKRLVNISSEDMDLKKEPSTINTSDHSEFLLSETERTKLEEFFKLTLGDRTNTVKFTDKLTTSPALVTSAISPHMRKMMKNMMKEAGQSSSDALDGIPVTFELNQNSRLIKGMVALIEFKPHLAKLAVKQLFDNSCIAAGMVEDPRLLLGNLNELLETCVFADSN